MNRAGYRKINDRSHSSSKYHKLDGTAARAIMNREAAVDVADGIAEGLQATAESWTPPLEIADAVLGVGNHD